MFARLVLPLIILLLANVPAMPQSNLKPNPTPRVPPQEGQGLPLADRQFIARASNLSEAEIQAAQLAVEKVQAGPLRSFAEKLAADHKQLHQTLVDLAHKSRTEIDPHPSRATWQADLQRLRGLDGAEFEREFLAWQLQVHLSLADLYQTQASSSPETALARFAIVSLNRIQDRFDEAKRLGASQGLKVDTIKQPPQY
jgi:predicted outer membrane protein